MIFCAPFWLSFSVAHTDFSSFLAYVMQSVYTTFLIPSTTTATVWFHTWSNLKSPTPFETSFTEKSCVIVWAFCFFRLRGLSLCTYLPTLDVGRSPAFQSTYRWYISPAHQEITSAGFFGKPGDFQCLQFLWIGDILLYFSEIFLIFSLIAQEALDIATSRMYRC